jgi:hypothetical protein
MHNMKNNHKFYTIPIFKNLHFEFFYSSKVVNILSFLITRI